MRKQIRHIPNFLRKLRGRPQYRQRECWRTLNFGLRFALAIMLFLAMRPVVYVVLVIVVLEIVVLVIVFNQ